MTYKQALEQGYKPGAVMYQRGYISRKIDPMAQEVHTAGGNRRGQLYILLPCKTSTRYCFRQYLKREGAAQ